MTQADNPDPKDLNRRSLLRAAMITTAAAGLAAGAPRAADKPGKTHVLPSTAATVKVGVMDPAVPSVLEIESGDVVHYPNTWVNWLTEAKTGISFAERE